MFRNHDWIITSLMAILITIGATVIYSATFSVETVFTGQGLFTKQLFLIFLGFAIYFLFFFIDHRLFKEQKILFALYIFTILILIFVKFFTPEVAETNRWIQIGPINIQPAEYSKLTIIIVTASISSVALYGIKFEKYLPAKLLALKLSKKYPDILVIIKSILVALPILLLIFIQPALGNTIIASSILLSILLINYPDKRLVLSMGFLFISSIFISYTIYFLYGSAFAWIAVLLLTVVSIGIVYVMKAQIVPILLSIIIGTLIIPVSTYTWNNVLKDYQKQRIETFIDPSKDPQGAGWQVRQSQIAIGSGRIFGKGFLQGTQTSFKILPYAHTDFIFAALAEEFGLVGSVFTIIVLLSLCGRIYYLAMFSEDKFGKSVLYGTANMLLTHSLINIGMNLGSLPVTGIPLPLISYGGSSILVNMAALGLVQNIIKNTRYNQSSESFLVRGKTKIPLNSIRSK